MPTPFETYIDKVEADLRGGFEGDIVLLAPPCLPQVAEAKTPRLVDAVEEVLP